jgi:hypothetical protein
MLLPAVSDPLLLPGRFLEGQGEAVHGLDVLIEKPIKALRCSS